MAVKYLAVVVLWILVFCCYSSLQAAASQIHVKPENTAVVAGESVSLHCASDISSLSWASSPTGLPPYTRLVNNCELNPAFLDSYALENVGPSSCDLVLLNATASHAILHHCIEPNGWDPAESVMIAVVDSEPQCSMDNMDPRINDVLTLTCTVSYTDTISPMQMFWTDEWDQPVASSSSKTSAGMTTSSLTFTVTSFTLPRYTCTTNFSDPVGLPVTAINTPSLTFNWTSPQPVVKAELMSGLNTAEVVGNRVVLTCRQRSTDIVWNFAPVNTSSSVTVVGGCTTVSAFADRYSVDTTYEACHLVIEELTLAHAGTYTCQDLESTALPPSAQLIVLETVPQCLADDVIEPGISIGLTCSVAYSGNFAPVMTWTDETGVVLPSNSDTTRTRVESRVIVTPVDTSNAITARTYFKEPSVELPGHVDPATNAPNYTHLWTIRLLLPDEQGTTVEDMLTITMEEFVTTNEEQHMTDPEETTMSEPVTTSQPSTTTTASTTTTTTATTTTTPTTTTTAPDLEDCGEIKKTYPSAQSGKYFILIRATQRRMEVYCDMDTTGGGWTVFQRRQDGSVTFYRNWASYVTGFGERDAEFWLGNDNLAALTANKQYVLRVDLGDWSNNRRYAQYTNFRVLGAADKYQLSSLGSFSGDAGDSLTHQFQNHLGMKFSTYDQDNDVWGGGNCAMQHRGAWWYHACFYSSLNGEYNNNPGAGVVIWLTWKGQSYSLKFTEMKIRSANF